jgi:predicted phosphoribosyltransferase
MLKRFENRREAGRLLAKALGHYCGRDVVVFALPRGGVPVGFEVAKEIGAPLHAFIVRKLGVPGYEEYAMGAMASGNAILLNEDVIQQLRIPDREVDAVIEAEKKELKRRQELYSQSAEPGDLHDRIVILVDDGLATGSTMKVAVAAVRQQDPRHVIVAVPVAPASALSEFQTVADEFVCLLAPDVFYAVGQWYEDFSQTSDEEVRELLARAETNVNAAH